MKRKSKKKTQVVEVQRDSLEIFDEIMKNSKGWTVGQDKMTKADHMAVVERLRNKRK